MFTHLSSFRFSHTVDFLWIASIISSFFKKKKELKKTYFFAHKKMKFSKRTSYFLCITTKVKKNELFSTYIYTFFYFSPKMSSISTVVVFGIPIFTFVPHICVSFDIHFSLLAGTLSKETNKKQVIEKKLNGENIFHLSAEKTVNE